MRVWTLFSFLGLVSVACTTTTTGDGTNTSPGTGTPTETGKPRDGTTGETKPKPPVDPTTDPNAPACTGAPGSLYAVNVTKLDSTDSIPLCRFQGSVLMIVNVASACGSTPQYKPMQELYDKYRSKGFYVLGFPCNQFGEQESGSDKEISTFCTNQYGITFPMFTKGNVNPPDVQPVYQWLRGQPGMADEVAWNFEKFLISRTGKIVARIPTGTEPDDPSVIAQIEAELAK